MHVWFLALFSAQHSALQGRHQGGTARPSVPGPDRAGPRMGAGMGGGGYYLPGPVGAVI